MLTALSIGNFKAFAKAQRIPIRPLTLIYGANSSGKSSVLHSLLLARHAKETGNLDVHRTKLGGESVDLGGFRQFVYQRDVNRRVEWTIELDARSFENRLVELPAPISHLAASFVVGIALDDIGIPAKDALPELHSYEVFLDGESFLRMSRLSKGRLQLDRLNYEHSAFRKAFIRWSNVFEMSIARVSDYKENDHIITKVVPNIFAQIGTFLPEHVDLIDEQREHKQIGSFAYLLRKGDIESFVKFVIIKTLNELLGGIAQTFYEELNRLRYLGPLRSYPPRNFEFTQYRDPNFYSGGEYAWDLLRRDSSIRNSVNTWLSANGRLQTPYELVVRELVRIDQLDEILLEGLESLELDMIYEEVDYGDFSPYLYVEDPESEAENLLNLIRSSDIEKLNELAMIDQRSNTIVSHLDVGIGVSQVLPVLVDAYSAKNKIIAIEQPEIHLHPALQADLGDVFIQSALGKGKNRFLIESHSEHLLLRIMRRMRETSNGKLPNDVPAITSKDVCVLFVQPKGASSVIRQLELDDEGDLLDAWPGGFFEEGFRERFA